MIEKRLSFLTPQQFGCVRQDDVVEMGGDHRAGVDHGVAQHMCLLTQTGVNPHRRQTEGRVLGHGSGQRTRDAARINRQIHARERLAGADLDPLERQTVGVWAQLEVIADMHRGRQKADFLRELLAKSANPFEQLAVLPIVDQRN